MGMKLGTFVREELQEIVAALEEVGDGVLDLFGSRAFRVWVLYPVALVAALVLLSLAGCAQSDCA
jgi:hypothetical protein